jgi:YjjG family noncanonical pyrimidine nucleotidase
MYKNLFFDADGTLFDFDKAEQKAFAILSKKAGFSLTEQVRNQYRAANARCWAEFETGSVTLQQLKTRRFDLFSEEAGLALDSKEVSAWYEEALSVQGILFGSCRHLLGALSKRGYRLYLASNGIARVQRGRIARSAIGHWFEEIFISEEIGYPKPDRRFFSHMLEKTGLTGHERECVMIGDSLSSDIRGGIDSGMATLWLNRGRRQADTGPVPTYECASFKEILSLFPPLY